MRTLTRGQRLARAIEFIGRASSVTPTQERAVIDTLTKITEHRPALLDKSWPDLLEQLVVDGSEVDLFTPEVRAQLERRIAAAIKRRDRTWTKQPPPQREQPRLAA